MYSVIRSDRARLARAQRAWRVTSMYYYRSTPEGPSESIIPCHPMAAVCAVAPFGPFSAASTSCDASGAATEASQHVGAVKNGPSRATAQHRHGRMELEGPSGMKTVAVETPPTPPDARRRASSRPTAQARTATSGCLRARRRARRWPTGSTRAPRSTRVLARRSVMTTVTLVSS